MLGGRKKQTRIVCCGGTLLGSVGGFFSNWEWEEEGGRGRGTISSLGI